MSLWKRWFGGKPEAAGDMAPAGAPAKTIAHGAGFTIHASPFKSEGQFQTAGTIEKMVAGARREHRFIRADRHASLEEAVEFSLNKGRQIVDQQGERIFDDPPQRN